MGRTREAAAGVTIGQRHVVVEARRTTTGRRGDSRIGSHRAHEASQARGIDRDGRAGCVTDITDGTSECRRARSRVSVDGQIPVTGQSAAEEDVSAVRVQVDVAGGKRHRAGEGQAVEATPVQTIELGRSREAAGRVSVGQRHVVVESCRTSTVC